MPRISPKILKKALQHSSLLPPLLKANPNLDQAILELKWIKDELPKNQWLDAVHRRSKLEPLQYILGSQPFGSLDILCKPNVLIPRWETEEWALKLSGVVGTNLQNAASPINIVDICTGSGCIPLLLHHELAEIWNVQADIYACDISRHALDLSLENLKKYEEAHQRQSKVRFKIADIFDKNSLKNIIPGSLLDLVISNPPYIPLDDFNSPVLQNGVEKSVRLYEPTLALVGENEFYEALINNVVLTLDVSGFVFELGYKEQVEYVVHLLKQRNKNWVCGVMKDSNANVRCVVGWLAASKMSFLHELCDEVYEK